MAKLSVVLVLLCFSMHCRANDLSEAEALARTCTGCHGGDNQTIPAFEYSDVQMFETLMAFKRDERVGTVMNRLAKGYSSQQLKLIAEQLGK